MDIFLRLKHWHVFMLTFGIYFGLTLFQLVFLFIEVEFPFNNFQFNRFEQWLSVASTVAFAVWSWVVGFSLAEKRPYDNLNESLFKVGLVLEVAFTFMETIVFPTMNLTVPGLTWVMNIASFGLGLYCDYFIIKALTSVEQDREASFSEFVGSFFLLIIYPIGIWWIQPRVNNIFDDEAIRVNEDVPLDQFR